MLLVFVTLVSPAEAEEPPHPFSVEQCEKGMTIFCLSLGMQEENRGNREQAFRFYKLACKTHPRVEHFRACTPYLVLARELGRLDEAVTPLEMECTPEKKNRCFHLGKEYLRVGEPDRAAVHLEPLCRQNYQPQDSGDYGPCYHLAEGLERSRHYSEAREFYQLDCDRDPAKLRPSCDSLKRLDARVIEERQRAWNRVKDFDSIELIICFLALMPVLGVAIWTWGGRKGLEYLRLHGLGILLMFWVAWESRTQGRLYYPADRGVVYFSLLLGLGLAVLAHRKLEFEEHLNQR